MLVVRRTYFVRGDLYKPCVHKAYWEFTGKNLLLGPWGTISLVITPTYLVQNTWTYVRALYQLRDALDEPRILLPSSRLAFFR